MTLLAFPAAASAALVTVRGVAPDSDNADTTCAGPAILTARTGPATIQFQWSGRAAGRDSLPGIAAAASFAWVRWFSPGWYTIRVWASDAGGNGCDTTWALRVKSPPWKPRITP